MDIVALANALALPLFAFAALLYLWAILSPQRVGDEIVRWGEWP